MVLADGGDAQEGRCRVFGVELRFLDQTDVNLLQLKPLPELVDSGQSGTGAMERSVAAAAGEWVDIVGDVAVAVPTGSKSWVVRLLLLYLSDRPTSDCLREVVWLAVLSTHPPSLAGGEAAASPCRVDKAWTVGGGTCEGSDTSADGLLTAVADG